jgi:hypothetical protein
MTQIYIQMAQSVTGNVVLIILLLLVASLIGYLTAWYYSKSIHTSVIKGLEDERAGLRKNVPELNNDIKEFEASVIRLKGEITSLEKQIGDRPRETKGKKKHAKA